MIHTCSQSSWTQSSKMISSFKIHISHTHIEPLLAPGTGVIALSKADKVSDLENLSSSREDICQTTKCTMTYSGVSEKCRTTAGAGTSVPGTICFRRGWGRRVREVLCELHSRGWLDINEALGEEEDHSGGGVEGKIFPAKGSTSCWRLSQILRSLSFSSSISLCAYGLFSPHLQTKT